MSCVCSIPLQPRPAPAGAAQSARRLCVLLLCLLLYGLPAGSPAEETLASDYRVKAAFLYNFARFTTWPELPAGHFTLCLLGQDPLAEHTGILQDKIVHGRPLRIVQLDATAHAGGCQLLYIGRSQAHRLHQILRTVQGKPVLTVSDVARFTASGGMIGFLTLDSKIRFEINVAAATRADLAISSKLLTLAASTQPDRK